MIKHGKDHIISMLLQRCRVLTCKKGNSMRNTTTKERNSAGLWIYSEKAHNKIFVKIIRILNIFAICTVVELRQPISRDKLKDQNILGASLGWFSTWRTGRLTDAMRQNTSESERQSRKRRFQKSFRAKIHKHAKIEK